MGRAEPTVPNRASRRIAGLCFALMATAVPALAQDDEPAAAKPAAQAADTPADRVKQLMPEVERRRNAINAELRRLAESPATGDDAWANEWAGEYGCGLGIGIRADVMIAPRAGLVYTNDGCLALTDVNYGRITRADSFGFSLELAGAPANLLSSFISDEYCFVRLGQRRCLLPRAMLEAFCEDLRVGRSVPDLTTLIRVEDQNKPLGPVSNIADEYRALINAAPTSGSVMEFLNVDELKFDDGTSIAFGTAILNRGSVDGLLPGLAIQISSTYPSARVLRASEHSSEATFSVLIASIRGYQLRAPKRGDHFDTGSYFEIPRTRPLPTPPIEAQIVEVRDVVVRDLKDGEGKAYLRGTIVIDIGAADRVEQDMRFRVRGLGDLMAARATRVEEHRCEIEFLQRRTEGKDDAVPAKGDWVTTDGFPWTVEFAIGSGH